MSANKRSESGRAGDNRRSKKGSSSPSGGFLGGGGPGGGSGGRKNRGDVGRALRTVYDDTVREPVPDDFLDLIGKLR